MKNVSSSHKHRTSQRLYAAALTARGEHHRAKRLVDCVLHDERKEVTGYRVWRCQHRNCLFCYWRYWQRFIRKYARKIERLMGVDPRLCFLTLTIPNTPSLNPKLYRWLAANLKKLMRRYPFKDNVVWAVSRIETDFNSQSQDFHVHIHMILICNQYIPQKAIAIVWRDVLGPQPNTLSDVPGRESAPCIVHIEKIKPESIKDTVSYLFKYRPIKEAEAFAEYECAVKNVRLVQSFGALRGKG